MSIPLSKKKEEKEILDLLEPDLVIPSQDVVTLSTPELIQSLQAAEKYGKYWEEGWSEFLWRIGSSLDLWVSWKDEPWVLPEIWQRTKEYTNCLYKSAALSHRFQPTMTTFAICRVGNIRLLEYLAPNLVWDPSSTNAAASGGHVACLEYAVQKKKQIHSNTTWEAAKHNQVAFLKRCVELELFWCPETSLAAARNGHLESVRMIHQLKQFIHQATSMEAVMLSDDNTAILAYLLQHNLPWHPRTTFFAALCGHLKTLKWCVQNQTVWDPWTSTGAAAGGHLSCLEFISKENLFWHPQTGEVANNNFNTQCAMFARNIKT